MLVQVYGDNAMKKTAVYKWVKLFLREGKVSLAKKIRTANTKQN